MSFEQLNLHPQITKALSLCGYSKPTPIQTQSIPDILLGRDMVASAQTGTGKTAAFVLPMLHKFATIKKIGNTPRVLILTPTRELATQITEAVSKYGKFLRCNIVSLVGGMPYRQQLRNLSRPIDIIVATPGRLMDHMSNGRLQLSDIETLILDEADRMLDMGFIDDVKNIASVMPENRQTLLFSATVDDRLTQIIRQFLKNPVRINVESEKLAPVKISQQLYIADHPQHKMELFNYLVRESSIFKAIIFSATKINADRLADELYEQGFAAAALHGDLKQSMRTRTLEQLRRGKIQFLVATDVAARGIDIQDITHVINFDLPKFSEDYVHRIGRTGRAGKDGIAISLALPSDGRHIQRIERLLRQTLERKVIPGLEPKKQLSNQAPSGKPKHKKKFGGKPGFKGKKEFAREGFEKRKAKKESPGHSSFERKPKKEFAKDRPDFAVRKPKKDFANERSGFADRKPKKDFANERSGFADRKPKKEFANERPGFARKPKKEFANERPGFADRKPKKDFASERSGFADRKPKKDFANERSGFADRKPKKDFANERSGFADRKPKKDFANERSGFADRKPKKDFANERSGFAARKPKKDFDRDRRNNESRHSRKEASKNDRNGFSADKPKKSFNSGSDQRTGKNKRPDKKFSGQKSFNDKPKVRNKVYK